MIKNTAIKDLISILPMPAVIVDFKGYIKSTNYLYNEKFKLNRLSSKNRIKLQTFLNFDVENILKRLTSGDTSVSTYDYKFNDLDENEITVDLHFNTIKDKEILLLIQEKNNFKTYMPQYSKQMSDIFMEGFYSSLNRNISNPITTLLGATELLNSLEKKDMASSKKLYQIIKEEGSKIKNFLNKVFYFDSSVSINTNNVNIHECLNAALKSLENKSYNLKNIEKIFDPSIPKVFFDKKKLIMCFENILINSIENNKNANIKIFTKIDHGMYIRSDDLQKVLKLPILIKIKDFGSGVDEKIEQFMFYPFVSNKSQSDGLGLTFTNITVSLYGGYLKYEKEKDGTAFNIYLPINKIGVS
ncbi:MAG: hypothetical protein CMP24_01360 [Rickettsiales bacterium]|nr:hypothetical protein [Rickettsiales bacterium]